MRAILCLGLTLFASEAIAATYRVFTDRAAFEAAAGPVRVETFDDEPIGPLPLYPGFGPIVAIAFDGFSLRGFDEDAGGASEAGVYAASGPDYDGSGVGEGNLLGWSRTVVIGKEAVPPTFGPGFVFDLPQPVTAFGFDWDDRDEALAYRFAIFSENVVEYVDPPFAPGSGTGFFGVVSDEPIFGAQLRAGSATLDVGQFGVDNVTLSAPIPLPPGFALLGAPLAALALDQARRRLSGNPPGGSRSARRSG